MVDPSLPGYRRAVAGRRLNSAIAGVTVLLALSACASSPEPVSTSTAPPETKASATQSAETTSATAEPADREVSDFTGFISPTGNIACMIVMDLARCDIIDRDWSPPPRPADCEFDYGHGIEIIAGQSPTFVCAGDTAFGAEDVLAYGDAITSGPLRCESAESGITCRDKDNGRGFTIGQQAYQLF